MQQPKILLIAALALALSYLNSASAIDVWQTRGDRQDLLAQKSSLAFTPGDGTIGLGIPVSTANRYQSVVGFGAAMTDSSAWLIDQKLNTSQRENLFTSLFSADNGIGLNYLRVPMGASDFTASGFYTYNDLPTGQSDPTQSQFSIAHDEASIIPALQQAQGNNPDLLLMGSPWSAPAWMKTNNSLFGGSLQSQFYGSYSTYLKKFIDAYTAAGLSVDALSVQNEPLFNPGDYPSMLMSAQAQLDLIKNHIGPEFDAAGIDTKLFAYDHNWDNVAFADTILSDPVARNYVEGTAFHGYAGNVSAQSALHNIHPDKSIYFTEISGGEFAPNFDDNLVWGIKNIIIGNLRNWGQTALYWNLALDENSGPHLNGCNDCRGVVKIDSNTGAVEFEEEYYTLAHASKFLERGAERIDSNSIDGVVETVAFQNPSGSRVLIALNPSASTRAFRIVENGQHVSYQLPRKSVVTFVWGDEPGDFNEDGSFSTADVNRLVAAIVNGADEPLFDLTDDGAVDQADLDAWLAAAGAANLPSGQPYLLGDANLDGTVDGIDFIDWNSNKFAETAAWSLGDFDANGVTDGLDFVIWNENKFTSSALPVPEPVGFASLISALLAVAALGRKTDAQPRR